MSPAKALRVFGNFWWDFIVGDTPEVAIGVALVVLLAWGLSHGPSQLVYLFPAAVMLVLIGTIWRGRHG